MHLATLYARAQIAVDAPLVTIESHLGGGLPSFNIVGLPEAAVKESKDRVRAALDVARFEFPRQRITVNLALADQPKVGGRFDLGIALSILAASGQLPNQRLDHYEFLGELSLGGELRPVRGVLAAALKARDAGRTLILPRDNAAEAALAQHARILPANTLLEVCGEIAGNAPLAPYETRPEDLPTAEPDPLDLSDVRGQHHGKRALEIAAAGGHSMLMIGPPGAGKTMLASRLPGILPPMTEAEALETAAIASISDQGLDPARWRRRVVRAPHHTASGVALVGGGSTPRPGEISLAHNGVLFLDELPEFDRKVLEVLREPLESGRITISRAAHQTEFPARFQLIAAMNPCPRGDDCAPEEERKYRDRISKPLLDRIDLFLEIPRVRSEELRTGAGGDGATSAQTRERVEAARERQLARAGKINAHLNTREVDRDCLLGEADQQLLHQASAQLRLSARAYHRILRLARTIADLAGREGIEQPHLMEAIGYRRLDNK